MLVRVDSFYDFFENAENDVISSRELSISAGYVAGDMMHVKDYEALAAVCMKFEPNKVLEIGTYLGVTSNFILTLLPHSSVVSIAYLNPTEKVAGKRYNNSDLNADTVGSYVELEKRGRFTQEYVDSHEIVGGQFIERFGWFDLVFIDGDHSDQGVRMDTCLANTVCAGKGVICWHDANPKNKYMAVRNYLETQDSFRAVATKDDYIGGIAAWSPSIEAKLSRRLNK